MSETAGSQSPSLLRMRLSLSLRKLQIILFIFGALSLVYAGFVLIHTAVFQRLAINEFNKNAAPGSHTTGQESVTQGKTPLQPTPEGMPFAHLEIQRLKLDAVVVEGDSDGDLREAIGHIPSTALPGNPGNVGIAGHRDTFFRPLRNIRKGDLVTLTTLQGTHQYEVESTEVVVPKDTWVLAATPHPSLTLVTCFPFYYIGSAPKRFIVHAREIGPVASSLRNPLSQ